MNFKYQEKLLLTNYFLQFQISLKKMQKKGGFGLKMKSLAEKNLIKV